MLIRGKLPASAANEVVIVNIDHNCNDVTCSPRLQVVLPIDVLRARGRNEHQLGGGIRGARVRGANAHVLPYPDAVCHSRDLKVELVDVFERIRSITKLTVWAISPDSLRCRGARSDRERKIGLQRVRKAETARRDDDALDPDQRGDLNGGDITRFRQRLADRDRALEFAVVVDGPPHAADQLTTQDLAGTSIAAGLNLLEREIAGDLRVIDTLDINSSRDLETGSQRTQIGVGKYLGQDLYVKYAQSLSEPDRDLLIEYQISDHLLLQSEVSRQVEVEQASTMYNLDLKYRFEY